VIAATLRPTPSDAIEFFITRWENSGAAERANYQMFLSELCDILEVPRPDPTSPDPAKNLYVFDRTITRVNPDGSSVTNYIDLYKARHFVNETKQGISESGGDHRSPSPPEAIQQHLAGTETSDHSESTLPESARIMLKRRRT
jgi:hypothetical protein